MGSIHPDVLALMETVTNHNGQELMDKINENTSALVQAEKEFHENRQRRTKLLVALNLLLIESCSDDTGEHDWKKSGGFYGNWYCTKCHCNTEKP